MHLDLRGARGKVNTSKVNEWLHIVGNLGVLGGLVFLALEIRQTNRIAIATAEITVRESFASSNESVYANPEIAALLARARQADAEFSDTELVMLDYWLSRMTNIWIQIDRAYSNGMVSEATFAVAIADMKWTIDEYPALRSYVEEWADTYHSNSDTRLYQAVKQHLDE